MSITNSSVCAVHGEYYSKVHNNGGLFLQQMFMIAASSLRCGFMITIFCQQNGESTARRLNQPPSRLLLAKCCITSAEQLCSALYLPASKKPNQTTPPAVVRVPMTSKTSFTKDHNVLGLSFSFSYFPPSQSESVQSYTVSH